MTVEQLLSECDLVRLTEEKLAACKPFSCGEGDLDERLEAKYMGIGVGRLPLNTRLMYFDLLKLKVNS